MGDINIVTPASTEKVNFAEHIFKNDEALKNGILSAEAALDAKIGDLAQLPTDMPAEAKANLVKAVAELFQSVGNGKQAVFDAIAGKRQTPGSKDYDDLVAAINAIVLGSGDALEKDVRQGKTFTNDAGVEKTGAMEKNDFVPYGGVVDSQMVSNQISPRSMIISDYGACAILVESYMNDVSTIGVMRKDMHGKVHFQGGLSYDHVVYPYGACIDPVTDKAIAVLNNSITGSYTNPAIMYSNFRENVYSIVGLNITVPNGANKMQMYNNKVYVVSGNAIYKWDWDSLPASAFNVGFEAKYDMGMSGTIILLDSDREQIVIQATNGDVLVFDYNLELKKKMSPYTFSGGAQFAGYTHAVDGNHLFLMSNNSNNSYELTKIDMNLNQVLWTVNTTSWPTKPKYLMIFHKDYPDDVLFNSGNTVFKFNKATGEVGNGGAQEGYLSNLFPGLSSANTIYSNTHSYSNNRKYLALFRNELNFGASRNHISQVIKLEE